MRGLGPGFGSPALTVQSLSWAPTPSAGARTWQIYGRVLHRCAALQDVASSQTCPPGRAETVHQTRPVAIAYGK